MGTMRLVVDAPDGGAPAEVGVASPSWGAWWRGCHPLADAGVAVRRVSLMAALLAP
jgi:hypothetical protein